MPLTISIQRGGEPYCRKRPGTDVHRAKPEEAHPQRSPTWLVLQNRAFTKGDDQGPQKWFVFLGFF